MTRWNRTDHGQPSLSAHDRHERDVYEEFSGHISQVIGDVARRSEKTDLETAVATLHKELEHAGVRASDEWCQGVLETLRRGEPLTIDME
jgi:hypothetical protein